VVTFQKIVIIGSQEKRALGLPRHVIADVVLIDTTHPENGRPTLYQVKETEFSSEQRDLPVNSLTQLGEDLFVAVGRVVSRDKETKQIRLANDDLVSYRHLITVGGQRDATDFHPVLQTLLESIRIQKSIQRSPLVRPSSALLLANCQAHREYSSLSCAASIGDATKSDRVVRLSLHTPSACSIQLPTR
jgi:hypothetical protein